MYVMYHICRNFRGVKFLWLKPPTKIGRHGNFATLTVCSMKRWLLRSEKSYACMDTMFTTAYGKLMLEKRWFAQESRGTLMTGTQWQAVIFRGSQIFVGLIFVVEGTHENLNPTKISVYTV